MPFDSWPFIWWWFNCWPCPLLVICWPLLVICWPLLVICWWWWWWCSVKSENGAPASGSRTESMNSEGSWWLLEPLWFWLLFWLLNPFEQLFWWLWLPFSNKDSPPWSQLEEPRTCSCNDTSRDWVLGLQKRRKMQKLGQIQAQIRTKSGEI